MDDRALTFFKEYVQQNIANAELKSFDDYMLGCIKFLDSTMRSNFLSRKLILYEWYKNIFELNFLNPYLEDNHVCEIIIQDLNTLQLDLGSNLKTLRLKINNFTSLDFHHALKVQTLKESQKWDFKNPFCSFLKRKNNYSMRVSLAHKCLMHNQEHKLNIRILRNQTFPLESFYPKPSFIKESLSLKENILIVGKTNSGKTSLARSMIQSLNDDENIITLEDTPELFTNKTNITRFVANEELKNKSLKDLLSYTLRMRPDRIILGEIRSHEVVPLLLSLNTGHKGLITTLHANSPKDAIDRLVLLFSLYHNSSTSISTNYLTKLIVNGFDMIIFMDEQRKISQAVKLLGSDGDHVHFEKIIY